MSKPGSHPAADARLSRRHFVRDGSLWVAAAWLGGCTRDPGRSVATATPLDAQPPLPPPMVPGNAAPAPTPLVSPSAAPSGPAASTCILTPDNIEGPYYRAGAPIRADLADAGMPGTKLVLHGRVTGSDCRPLSRALLDVWQADSEGRYDNDGHAGNKLILRGKLVSNEDGTFELRTIIPGHYLNGKQYRPAHIHVKVSAPGFAPLTTQLYFEGDPYNQIDPFIKKPLVMRLENDGAGKVAQFDFALKPT